MIHKGPKISTTLQDWNCVFIFSSNVMMMIICVFCFFFVLVFVHIRMISFSKMCALFSFPRRVDIGRAKFFCLQFVLVSVDVILKLFWRIDCKRINKFNKTTNFIRAYDNSATKQIQKTQAATTKNTPKWPTKHIAQTSNNMMTPNKKITTYRRI